MLGCDAGRCRARGGPGFDDKDFFTCPEVFLKPRHAIFQCLEFKRVRLEDSAMLPLKRPKTLQTRGEPDPR